MDKTEFLERQYASFLVRLWRRPGAAPGDASGEWQGEVEHIQSGERWAFGSAQELYHFLGPQKTEVSQLAKEGLETP